MKNDMEASNILNYFIVFEKIICYKCPLYMAGGVYSK